MAPSPSANTTNPPPIPDSRLEMSRALRYAAITGKLDYFDTPYWEREQARKRRANRRAYQAHHTTQTHAAQTHAQAHSSTSTLPHTPVSAQPLSAGVESVIHIEQDRLPYDLIPIVRAAREEREAQHITPADYGKRWKAAYRAVIGAKPECGPGEHGKAAGYLWRIQRAIEDGGWTPSENNRLHALERKWRERAEGRDARFEVVGTYRGRPGAGERREIHDRKVLADIARIARGGR
jgi:hypothetical protein